MLSVGRAVGMMSTIVGKCVKVRITNTALLCGNRAMHLMNCDMIAQRGEKENMDAMKKARKALEKKEKEHLQ